MNSEIRTNLFLVDSLMCIAANHICSGQELTGYDTISINIERHGASFLLKDALIKKCIRKIYNSDIILMKHIPSLDIFISRLSLIYGNTEDSPVHIIRRINLEIRSVFRNKNNLLDSLPPVELEFCDTIARDSVKFLEDSNYSFACSDIPEPPKSFFKQIIEPAIVVITAAITVVLLFTIRSH